MIVAQDLGISFVRWEHRNRPGSWLFRNLHLTVETGESIAIIGPSGSGKSVLLKLIAGLLEPTEGWVHAGSGPSGPMALDRTHLSKVFQKMPSLTHLVFWRISFFLSKNAWVLKVWKRDSEPWSC